MQDGTWAVQDPGPHYEGNGPYLSTGHPTRDYAFTAASQMMGPGTLAAQNTARIEALERAVFGAAKLEMPDGF